MYNLNYKLNQMFQNDPKRQREEIEAQADLQASRTREPDARAGCDPGCDPGCATQSAHHRAPRRAPQLSDEQKSRMRKFMHRTEVQQAYMSSYFKSQASGGARAQAGGAAPTKPPH